MQKLNKIFLSFFLTLISCLLMSTNVKADSVETHRWGDFVYRDFCDDPGEMTIVKYTGKAKHVKIPSKIKDLEGGQLMSLGKSKYIQSVFIPNGMDVEGGALASCPNLKKIIVSKNNPDYMVKNKLLLSKDGKTLIACPGGLKTVKIPDSVIRIGDGAFEGSSIKKITLGKNVRSIGVAAFYKCKNLTSIKFNKKLKKIELVAFDTCTSLTSVKLPDSVTEIGDWVFWNCKKLETVYIGKKVKRIGQSLFVDCGKLRSVYIYNKNCKIKGFLVAKETSNGTICDVTIYGKENSTAKKNAKRCGVKFEVIKE